MALFGKKKEVKVDYSSLPEEMKPHLDIRKDVTSQQNTQAAPHFTQQPQMDLPTQETSYDYSQDLLNMSTDVSAQYPQYPQPAPVVAKPQMQRPVQQMQPVHQAPEEKMQPQEKPTFAPLFVKIDRYKNILKSMSELKTTLSLMRNSFAVLDQMEQLKVENMKLISNALDKVEKKLIALDAEFLRPSGFHDEMNEQYETESLQGVVSDLQSQIQQLKNEMQRTQ